MRINIYRDVLMKLQLSAKCTTKKNSEKLGT